MKRPQAHLSVNFGRKPFVFDIDGMITVSLFALARFVGTEPQQRQKSSIGDEINLANVSNLHPHFDENALVKELVAQFLAHDGYVETAKAFAEEVQTEANALNSGQASVLGSFAIEDDIDAVNRQRMVSSSNEMQSKVAE